MAKQQNLEGVPERQVIPAVTRAAEKFEELRDEWMKAGEPMRKAREKLIAVMEENGVTIYVEDDLNVVLQPGKKSVKVRRGDDEED